MYIYAYVCIYNVHMCVYTYMCIFNTPLSVIEERGLWDFLVCFIAVNFPPLSASLRPINSLPFNQACCYVYVLLHFCFLVKMNI